MSPKTYYSSLEKEKVECPICGSSSVSFIGEGDRYGMGLEVDGCNTCGLAFVNPRPVKSAMDDFYKTKYREFYESVEVPSLDYVAKGPFQSRADFVVGVLRRYLDEDVHGELLDIGCAEGTLLKTIKEDFPCLSINGLEPNPNFAAFAREHTGTGNIFSGTFEDFLNGAGSEKYDVITITHVLEHMPDPVKTLSMLRALLKKDGLLYVEVPNILDVRSKSIAQIHIAHLIYFDPVTLQLCLDRAGFQVQDGLLNDLPAKTPSMSVVARPALEASLSTTSQNFTLEPPAVIQKKHITLRENIFANIQQPKKQKMTDKVIRKIKSVFQEKFTK